MGSWGSYVVGAAAVAGIAAAWVGAQRAWARVFPDPREPDALARRLGCHGCGCADETCERELAGSGRPVGEEMR